MPRKSRIRDRRLYDDTRPTVAALRPINTAGQTIEVGSEIDHEITDSAFRRRLWASGRSEYADEFQPVAVDDGSDADDQDGDQGGELTENEQKDLLIAAIKERGGKATRSSKVETLQAKLDGLIEAENTDDDQDDDDPADDDQDGDQDDDSGADQDQDDVETDPVDETTDQVDGDADQDADETETVDGDDTEIPLTDEDAAEDEALNKPAPGSDLAENADAAEDDAADDA